MITLNPVTANIQLQKGNSCEVAALTTPTQSYFADSTNYTGPTVTELSWVSEENLVTIDSWLDCGTYTFEWFQNKDAEGTASLDTDVFTYNQADKKIVIQTDDVTKVGEYKLSYVASLVYGDNTMTATSQEFTYIILDKCSQATITVTEQLTEFTYSYIGTFSFSPGMVSSDSDCEIEYTTAGCEGVDDIFNSVTGECSFDMSTYPVDVSIADLVFGTTDITIVGKIKGHPSQTTSISFAATFENPCLSTEVSITEIAQQDIVVGVSPTTIQLEATDTVSLTHGN